MYGMTNSVKFFAYGSTAWLLDAGFIQSQCKMSIYYKYSAYGTKVIVLSHFDDFVYWYTSEALGKWFMYALGNILYVNFLGYAHWLCQS